MVGGKVQAEEVGTSSIYGQLCHARVMPQPQLTVGRVDRGERGGNLYQH